MNARSLTRAVLRVGITSAGAVAAFALFTGEDTRAHADDQSHRGLGATITAPVADAPEPVRQSATKPKAGAPSARLDRAETEPKRSEVSPPQQPPIERAIQAASAPLKPATERVKRVAVPATEPVGASLDAAPGIAGDTLARTRASLSAAPASLTDPLGGLSPALEDPATDVLAPLQPILGPPAAAPLPALQMLPVRLDRPAADPTAATPRVLTAPLPAVGPGAPRAPSTALTGDATSADPAQRPPALPDGDPASHPRSSSASASVDTLPAALAGQHAQPQMSSGLAARDQPHRPAGRSPKPTPGPA